MENYREFMDRICSFEKREFGINKKCFSPSESVLRKVTSENTFAPYFGDTVVFNLSDETKTIIEGIINTLYTKVPECFCQRLETRTLHMTLHDLSSSDKGEQIILRVNENYNKLLYLLNYRYKFLNQKIRMRSNYIINMVNTSVVLALYPVDEIEYEKLMYFYGFIDEIVKLPYPFTPHITLAYYNRYGFSEESANRLINVIGNLNKTSFEIVLDTRDLMYQRFENMNSYESYLKFSN